MINCQHFLLTRFNVRVNYDSQRTGVNPEWLAHRFDLFEKYCYPSVRSQTNLDFKWLVYFDSETPQAFRQKIQKYSEWQNFIPVYLNTEFTDEINRQVVSEYLNKNTEYLITTRLDNDDAVCRSFVQKFQDCFDEQEIEFISLVNGYVLNDRRLYLFRYPNNPFTSLIERIDHKNSHQFRTILCGEHSQISAVGKLRKINGEPAWLQVVHGKNVSNRVRGTRQPISKLDGNFEIFPTELSQTESIWLYWLDKFWSYAKQPLEFIMRQLPSNLRGSIRKFLT
jgi:Putative rhamnosyl transferase